MESEQLSAHHKALRINIDASCYGTFAEIGAGQEVARWFFRVGGAAGTVAKTMSAYDMTFSDAIYGHTERFVSRQRLQTMLDREYELIQERLGAARGLKTRFFVFADTVATRSYSHPEEGQGWMGIRFQSEPLQPPSQIIIHARMWEKENLRQQEALGVLGVNLIYGAFHQREEPERLIGSLMDELTRDRMEVDMIKFSGPAFDQVENRLMSLQLVQQRLTNAAVFTADGEVVEPAEVLHEQPVLIERGSFRPLTNVTLDMLDRALEQMRREPGLEDRAPAVLMEMTLRNLMTTSTSIDHADFLARVDTLSVLGKTVMVSNYSRFHTVTSYLRRYTHQRVVMVLGAPTLAQLFNDKYYEDIEGGVLEALGRLFSGNVALYIYPWKNKQSGEMVTADNFKVAPPLRHLYAHLRGNNFIVPIQQFTKADLEILPREVLGLIQSGNPAWTNMVPAPVAAIIQQSGLFGYQAKRS